MFADIEFLTARIGSSKLSPQNTGGLESLKRKRHRIAVDDVLIESLQAAIERTTFETPALQTIASATFSCSTEQRQHIERFLAHLYLACCEDAHRKGSTNGFAKFYQSLYPAFKTSLLHGSHNSSGSRITPIPPVNNSRERHVQKLCGLFTQSPSPCRITSRRRSTMGHRRSISTGMPKSGKDGKAQ